MTHLPPLRLLGLLLLLVALALHIGHVRSGASRSQGADALRHVAALPALSLGIAAAPIPAKPDAAPAFQLCPPAAVDLFRTRLAQASAARPPADYEPARAYDFSLVLTNHVRALFHGTRAAASDELWLSLREPAGSAPADAAPGAGPALREWPAACVTGLGNLLDLADEGRLSVVVPLLQPHPGDHGFTERDVADTAAMLRRLAALPFARAEAVRADGSARPRALGPEAMPALAAAFSAAEPAALPPDGIIDGTDHTLLVFLEDGSVAMLRAAVPDDDPADALVGFRAVDADGASGETALATTPPARVPGLAALLVPDAPADAEAGAAAP